MRKQRTASERATPSASNVAKRLLGTARGAETRLPLLTSYLERDAKTRASIDTRLARASSRASTTPAAERRIEQLRAEIMSRAEVRHAFDAAPLAQAQVRDALAEYLEEVPERR